jgi:chromosome partitioning protein
MLILEGAPNLRKIAVLNPKGGAGKSTLALNLAGYLSCQSHNVALIDMDPQGSSSRWLSNRGEDRPPIHGIYINHQQFDEDGKLRIRVPDHITHVVIDAPARVPADRLIDYTCGAHAVLVPILPCDLDIHAASQLISNLLLVAQVSRRNGRIGVIANRVKERTIAYQQLMRFLGSLSIKVVGVLRDSQNYARAASSGLCLHEMPPSRVAKDLEQWSKISEWLQDCLARPLTQRDLLRPEDEPEPELIGEEESPRTAYAAVAAAVALAAMFVWSMTGAPNGSNADTVAMTTIEDSTVDAVVSSEPVTIDGTSSADFALGSTDEVGEFRATWELKGIATDNASRTLLMTRRGGNISQRVARGAEIAGWTVADIGNDFAVFRQDDAEMTINLNENETASYVSDSGVSSPDDKNF